MLSFVIWLLGLYVVDTQPQCFACSAGKYKNISANTVCVDCPANTYFDGSVGTSIAVCISCTLNSASSEGSSSVNSCICNAGYTKTGSTCSACAVGKFKSTSGDGSCQDCPMNSATQLTGRITSNDCQCNAGYVGQNGGPCSPSPAGSYKNSTGTGPTLSCPQNSISPAASTDITNCSCLPGYVGQNGGMCSPSPAGWYKDSTGSGPSLSCPGNSTSPSASTSITNCSCLPGYTGQNGGSCSACGAGRYKTGTNAGPCVNCPRSTFSVIIAATRIEDCTKCKVNSTALEGSDGADDCKCDAGYWMQDINLPLAPCLQCVPGKYAEQGAAACTDCGAGKYASASGSTSISACLTCLEGTYSLVNQSQCQSCGANAWSPAGSGTIQDCTCNAGFWPKNTGSNGGSCFPCEPGSYKEQRGSQACTLFPAGRYSGFWNATSATASLPCPVNSSSAPGSSAVTQCACVAGYAGLITQATDTCGACVPGKFRTAAALPNEACLNCPANTFSTATAKTDNLCSSCGTVSISPAGSSSSAFCMCPAGYGANV